MSKKTLKHHPGYWLRKDAAEAFDLAEDSRGIQNVTSAGRTPGEQQGLINRWNTGGTYNRPPYLYRPDPVTVSRHVIDGGRAIDLSSWRVFAEFCTDYGFIHPYPSGDPVHFEYTGNPTVSRDKTVIARQKWMNVELGVGLVVDGIPGPGYRAAVKQYQKALKSDGYYTGLIDGVWGPATEKAHDKYYAAGKPISVDLDKVVPKPGEFMSNGFPEGIYTVDKGESPTDVAVMFGMERDAFYTYNGIDPKKGFTHWPEGFRVKVPLDNIQIGE